MKSILKNAIIVMLAFTAAICSAVFICSCKKDDTLARMIVDAEQKVLEADEYCMTLSLSMEVSANGRTESAAASVAFGQITEGGNRVEFLLMADGSKLYRTRGLDIAYSEYGTLMRVEKSSGELMEGGFEPRKAEDFDGAKITLKEQDEERVFTVRFSTKDILKQLEEIPDDIGGIIDLDLSKVNFGRYVTVKCYVNKNGELYLTEIEDWEFSFKVQGITVHAAIGLSLYIETDRGEMNLPEVAQCVEYADYYTDEDNTLRWIKNYDNPETAELVSDDDHFKSYKIENHGIDSGLITGDSQTGNIAVASNDKWKRFCYVDIYDKDMHKIQTLCLRGAAERIRLNKSYISLDLKDSFLDGSNGSTVVVVNIDDGQIVLKKQLSEYDYLYTYDELFGNSFAYRALTSSREIVIYNFETKETITPTFNGKPISGFIYVNNNGNLLVDSGEYALEINDLGEVVASREIVTKTLSSTFIGKYFKGAEDYYGKNVKVYYNAEEEIEEIDIGEYPGRGSAQFIYIDDSYAVILDSAGSGYFIYDFTNREYILHSDHYGTIEFNYYLGSARWLTDYFRYSNGDYINIFGV